MALDILKAAPRFKHPFIFSTTGGRKVYTGWAKAKVRLDELSGVTGWVLHDLRRTFRTRIAPFKISETVKELVIGHAQTGLHAVYDQFSYRQERLEVFQMWERELSSIVNPPAQTNIVPLAKRPVGLAHRPLSARREAVSQ
jgi:integrase